MVLDCCPAGFKWDGQPEGKEIKYADQDAYVTGDNPDRAILYIHDGLGWKFSNARLLADHYAKEVGATVYVPNFFPGVEVPIDAMIQAFENPGSNDFDWRILLKDQTKENRSPDILNFARALRSQYKRVGAVGFCWGGWAVFHLADKANNGLVDAISTAHPSLLTQDEMAKAGVPVQIHAPETDFMFKPEDKAFANEKLPSLGIAYDYQYYPGLAHGFGTRGDPKDEPSRKGMVRAKNATVAWFQQWLAIE
ncbi:Dienelactone hydrolase-like protein 2 [Elsinoe fawcettii]|nr:Dienelactone hydrolase-like protein 2 [Elsinoe fawcettii]